MKEMKKHKSEDELCQYLHDKKNIGDIFENRSIIKNRSYVSSINPYKKIFSTGTDINGNHIYPNTICVNEYRKLIEIDDLFASKYSNLIGAFERKFKLKIINVLCQRMVNSGDVYCVEYARSIYEIVNNFKLNRKISKMPYDLLGLDIEITKNGEQLNTEISASRIDVLLKIADHGVGKIKAKNSLVRHYQKNYPIVPFWLLAHILTLGELAILFNMLSEDDKFYIVKSMNNNEELYRKDIFTFEKNVEQIRILRNIINHYEPVFPYFQNQNPRNFFYYLLSFESAEIQVTKVDYDFSQYLNDYSKKHINDFIEFIELINKRQ